MQRNKQTVIRQGGEIVITALFIVTTAICAIGWLSSRLAANAIVYYMVKKGYKPPSEDEIEECTRAAAKKMFKISK